MGTKIRQGQFEAIDSFAIRSRSEFYLIGRLIDGNVQKNWFLNIPLNKSFAITVRISAIEDIEVASEETQYKLVIVSCEKDDIDLLLGMKVGSENLDITIEGAD